MPSFENVAGGASSTAPKAKPKRFYIEAPDGKIFTIDGPPGSTGEQALEQLQSTYTPDPEKARVRQEQAAKYPSQQELATRPDARFEATKKQVMEPAGIDPESPIVGTATNLVKGLWNAGKTAASLTPLGMLTTMATEGPKGVVEDANKGADIVTGVATNLTRGPANIATGILDQDWERARMGLIDNMTQLAMMGLGGEAATMGLGKATAFKAAQTPLLTVPEKVLGGWSSIIKPGVTNRDLRTVAAKSIPVIQAAAARLKLTPERFKAMVRSYGTEVGKGKMFGAADDAIKLMDEASKIAQEPFEAVFGKTGKGGAYGTKDASHLKSSIEAKLNDIIRSNEKLDPPRVEALRGHIETLRKAETWGDLNEFKKLANKNAAPSMDKLTGDLINMNPSAAQAWKDVANEIRSELYKQVGSISGVDLADVGLLESYVLDARDGLSKTLYQTAIPGQLERNRGFLRNLGEAIRHRDRSAVLSLFERGPMGQFSKDVQRTLASPAEKYAAPTMEVPPATIRGKEGAVAAEIAPSGDPITEPLLAPPPGTSPAIGQDIFAVQQRANQAARRAPPETIAGTQPTMENWFVEPPKVPGRMSRGSQVDAQIATLTDQLATIEQQLMNPYQMQGLDPDHVTRLFEQRSRLRQQLGKLEALPEQQSLVGQDRPLDPSLLGVEPTFPKFNLAMRETYTLKDLNEMVREIETFLRSNPRHRQATELRTDLSAIQNEINRRVESRR